MKKIFEILEAVFITGIGVCFLIGFTPAFVRIEAIEDEGMWFLLWSMAAIVSTFIGIFLSIVNDKISEKNRQK